jgi:predicted small metal-binding protein
MKEFVCSKMGNKCNWKHVARTEELLVDIAAIHLRDVHGVREIGPDMLGKIKNLFTSPTGPEAARSADLVLKEYNCDMHTGCTWRYIAMTEELIADGAAVHAREAHGIKEFTPEMIARVKQSAHAWKGEELKRTA